MGDEILFLEDIPTHKIAELGVDQDSATWLKNYVNDWVETRILLQNAQEVLQSDLKDLEELLTTYMHNLLVYELEKNWVENFSDTLFTREELFEYYEQNKDNFQLRSNIVKMRYLKLDKNISKKDLTFSKNKLFNPSQEGDSLLRIFAEKQAENFYLDDNWLQFDDVLREVPISSNFSQQRFLQNNRQVNLEDQNYIYLVFFMDFKIKDDISPFEMEESQIKTYILLQKKAAYIAEKRKEVINNAYSNAQVKLWEKK